MSVVEGAPAIEAVGLTKTYRGVAAVDQLSFTVPSGSVTGFLGPNGAGKTTTIRMLLGLCAPTRGDASVLGMPLADTAAYLPRVGALVESPAFYPGLSGRRNLEVLAALGATPTARVDEVLDIVGLTERARSLYAEYSLGMKQRLGLAAALLADPDLLVLDEPTNGLDPAGIAEVRQLLRRLADAAKTVFVSSHLLAELEQTADWLVFIRRGRLLLEGRVDELFKHRERLVARPARIRDLGRLARLASDRGYPTTRSDGRVIVTAPARFAGELNRRAMAAGITVVELYTERPSLEATFMEMTEDDTRVP